MESSVPSKHKDHIAGKGITSMTHYNFVHKLNPMPQAMKKIQMQKWTRNGKKLETIPASMATGKIKSKKEVILEAQRDKKKVHFATLMDICHLKNAELVLFFIYYRVEQSAVSRCNKNKNNDQLRDATIF